jgi:hypothetical protein
MPSREGPRQSAQSLPDLARAGDCAEEVSKNCGKLNNNGAKQENRKAESRTRFIGISVISGIARMLQAFA